jgi:hypothetical protein
MQVGFWWKVHEKRDHSEYLDVGEKIILKWILEIQDVMLWTIFIWLRPTTDVL